MKTLRTALAGLLLLGGTYVQAQTADDVVNKYINAVGGAAVIGSIKSVIMDGELLVNGMTLNSKLYVVNGKALKSEVSLPDKSMTILECVTTEGGWSVNPMAGFTDPTPMPEDRVKQSQSDLDIGGKLYRYKEKGSSIELAGNESIEGVNAVKLKLKDKDGRETLYFFDPTTYYIIRSETTITANGQELPVSVKYSNYKKTDIGYVLPFTRVRNVGQELTNNITKIEFNKEIDPKVFEMPK